MPKSERFRSWLLVLQFWLSIFRLIIALYGLIIISVQIHTIRVSTAQKVPPIYPDPGSMTMLSFQLVTWVSLVLNDLYMVAIDFMRTNTYIGCVGTQAGLSVCAIIVTATSLLVRRGWEHVLYLRLGDSGSSEMYTNYGPSSSLFVFPTVLGMILSLSLWAVAIWSALSHRPYISLRRTWKQNNKDLLVGTSDLRGISPTLSVIGQPRTSLMSAKKEIYAPGNAMGRFLARIMFRRVSPAETRVYAMVQNTFALASMFILVFRAITLLQKAQNQIGTRMKSDSCDAMDIAGRILDLEFIVAHDPLRRLYEVLPTNEYPLTTITMSNNGSTTKCGILGNQTDYRGRVFDCDETLQLPLDVPTGFWFPPDATFRIEVHSTNGTALYGKNMPDIWLSNSHQVTSQNTTLADDDFATVPSPLAGRAAWVYMPPWNPRPGFHIDAEVQLVIRRFIRSSFIWELVFNSEPTYERVLLFPIVESGASPLTNHTLATATLYPTLRPGYAYLRNWKAYRDLNSFEKGNYHNNILCTFIEDYREGSVLDVLGSIGGLFALLQSVHVLVFGRPMLWGLTGAKLITPFGLLGALSSRSFRRRLREQYYRQSVEGNPDTFLMGPFLRDFVVDLGPADINTDQVQMQSSSNQESSAITIDRDGKMNDCQLPLMLLELRQSPAFERTVDIEEISSRARASAENNA
ncbi:unnamed protein product [Rhizoctonia solani]|uniref:Uncharacterized protein n=1 Tax=Rhizoctonia solani TaxID=456999 RepID=A0A8H3AFK6_9AGAM|nr:unnamed protein product [Rhizoctonia solani]